jgi:hypothetical protein
VASYSPPRVRKSREICDLTRSSPQRYGSECKIKFGLVCWLTPGEVKKNRSTPTLES